LYIRFAMRFTNKLFALSIVFFLSCSSGDDYYYDYYTRYEYQQVVCFGASNRIIKSINYFDGLVIDSPNKNVSNLRVSPFEVTKFTVSDGSSSYDFELKMKFAMEPIDQEGGSNNYTRKYKGIDLIYSNAGSARILKYERAKPGSTSYYNRTTIIVDSLIIQ
jgi:hypothetical protein